MTDGWAIAAAIGTVASALLAGGALVVAVVAEVRARGSEKAAQKAEERATSAEKRAADAFAILNDQHTWAKQQRARADEEDRIRAIALRWCHDLVFGEGPREIFVVVETSDDRAAAELLQLNGCGMVRTANDGRTICELSISTITKSPGLVPTLRFYRERLTVPDAEAVA